MHRIIYHKDILTIEIIKKMIPEIVIKKKQILKNFTTEFLKNKIK